MANEKEKKPNIFKRIGKYVRDVVGELKKVTWPTGKELFSYTATVLVFIILMAVVIGVLDFAFSNAFTALGGIDLGAGTAEAESTALSLMGVL